MVPTRNVRSLSWTTEPPVKGLAVAASPARRAEQPDCDDSINDDQEHRPMHRLKLVPGVRVDGQDERPETEIGTAHRKAAPERLAWHGPCKRQACGIHDRPDGDRD